MDIKLLSNVLAAKDFVRLRKIVGMTETPLYQAEKALNNGLLTVAAFDNDALVGMGRLVGDGIMYWYIQDVSVLPEYQGKGIGKKIIDKIIEHIDKNSIPETRVTVGLIAAKDKELFYEKLGFIKRPTESHGAGMTKVFITSR